MIPDSVSVMKMKQIKIKIMNILANLNKHRADVTITIPNSGGQNNQDTLKFYITKSDLKGGVPGAKVF